MRVKIQERWYYLEAEQGGLQHWLKARTIGLPQAWNRLMSYKSVRSTRPVQYIPGDFITNPAYACRRDDFHLARHPPFLPAPRKQLNGQALIAWNRGHARDPSSCWLMSFCGVGAGSVDANAKRRGFLTIRSLSSYSRIPRSISFDTLPCDIFASSSTTGNADFALCLI